MKESLLRVTIDYAGRRHDFRVARHPSESESYLVARILAYALHHQPGLVFSRGLCVGDAPVLSVPQTGGRLALWIDVGPRPIRKKMRQAAGRSDEVLVYCYAQLPACEKIAAGCNGSRLAIYWLDPGFLRQLAKTVTATRVDWQLALNGDMLQAGEISGNRRKLYPRL